jgi:hypothetical protein
VLKTKKQPHNMITGIQNMGISEIIGVICLPLATPLGRELRQS